MIVRLAKLEDLNAVGLLARDLVRLHETFDPRRFMHLESPETGYPRFLAKEIHNKVACVLVGELDSKIVAYAYGRFEGRDYNALLDDAGKLHDIYVAAEARGRGIGEALCKKMITELEAKGAARVVLMTATQNESAHRLFERVGFRRTMIEMTHETRPTGEKATPEK